MTDEEAAAELKRYAKNPDTEAGHAAADQLLCDLLWAKGYEKTVKEFDAMKKWYS